MTNNCKNFYSWKNPTFLIRNCYLCIPWRSSKGEFYSTQKRTPALQIKISFTFFYLWAILPSCIQIRQTKINADTCESRIHNNWLTNKTLWSPPPNSFTFFCFCGLFLPSCIRIRQTKINADVHADPDSDYWVNQYKTLWSSPYPLRLL
jgi:hypothetical protein